MDEIRQMKFRAELLDPSAAEAQMLEGGKRGEAEVRIAAYGVVDTNRPVGIAQKQVIDYGAFRMFAGQGDFVENPKPMYLDHGGAITNGGYADSRLKIGKGDGFREEASGLVVHAAWNLEKQVAKEAFSDIIFNPRGEQFSFRWDVDKVEKMPDGREHVTHIEDISEFSQVGFQGAQSETGVLEGSLRMGVPAHSTAIDRGAWDSNTTSALSNDLSTASMARMYAFRSADAAPDEKSSYLFPHHIVDDGRVGAANVEGVQAAISELNKVRSANMSAGAREATYGHLVRHLKDAGMAGEKIPALRAEAPSVDEMRLMVTDDPEFGEQLDAMLRDIRDPYDKEHLVRSMQANPDLRTLMRSALEEAEKPNAVLKMYETMWNARHSRIGG